MRASGTLIIPRFALSFAPPKPVSLARPVSVLKTVVLPEPAKPTRPIFMGAAYARAAGPNASGFARGGAGFYTPGSAMMLVFALAGGMLLSFAVILRELAVSRERTAASRTLEELHRTVEVLRGHVQRTSDEIYVLRATLEE